MIDKEIATEWAAVIGLFVLLVVYVAFEIIKKARYPIAAIVYFLGMMYIHKLTVAQ